MSVYIDNLFETIKLARNNIIGVNQLITMISMQREPNQLTVIRYMSGEMEKINLKMTYLLFVETMSPMSLDDTHILLPLDISTAN